MFIIFTATSICAISSVDCLKGLISLQRTIINKENILYGLEYADISVIPYKLISLFYIGLILILVSSLVSFSKLNKIKSLIVVILPFVSSICVLITHDYIWFLILINLYLLIKILSELKIKDKVKTTANIIAVLTFLINLIQLIKHLQLTFAPSDVLTFQTTLLETSDITLKVIWLWFIPYIILLIQDIITTCKSKKTFN